MNKVMNTTALNPIALNTRVNKKLICLAVSTLALPALSHADSPYFSFKDGDGFKRFSVSVGALYVKPTGNAKPIGINTAVAEGETQKVGDVSMDSVINNLTEENTSLASSVKILDRLGLDSLPAEMSGSADIYNLSKWEAQGTGLEADDVTTLGIMTNYFFTDHVSMEVKAGIPPKVDIMGQGQISAPFKATAKPELDLVSQIPGGIPLGEMYLQKDLPITDLSKFGKVAEARAWTPAVEFQYHFGKTGVNKFRPYVGLGVMYAYFNELEMDQGLEKDLINAGHKIANIKNGEAGKALDGLPSTANPKVKLEASDAFAPVATAGFTYDFNDRWFAVGSVSYAHLTGETTITVKDDKLGELVNAKSDIEINPILGYAGVGYRF